MKLEEMVRDIVSGAVDEYLKEETGSVSPAVCSSSRMWSTCSGRGMN